jgi:threonyl-tRNA synthetase
MYALLEEALKKEKPSLPFWLAPTQVRLIPVGAEYLGDCEQLREQLDARVDIDDLDGKVGKKIRNAEMEWINMIIVVGEKERSSGVYPVRLRSGEQKNMTLQELKAEIGRLSRGYPRKDLPLPTLLSKRPTFRG